MRWCSLKNTKYPALKMGPKYRFFQINLGGYTVRPAVLSNTGHLTQATYVTWNFLAATLKKEKKMKLILVTVTQKGAFLVAQMVKNLSAMQDTWIWSLGLEAPLEKGMATHSSILTWRIPWTEESGRLWSMGVQSVRHDWASNTLLHEQKISQTLLF